MLPPDIKEKFFDNLPWQQAQLIAYEQIRALEEVEIQTISKVLK